MTDSTFPGATPSEQWRQNGEPDPFGNRYDCDYSKTAGGHLSDDGVAFLLGVLLRSDINHQGVLDMGKDRIRWLSRQLHKVRTERDALKDEVQRLRNVAEEINREWQAYLNNETQMHPGLRVYDALDKLPSALK